jgi:hypothetical protein
MSCTQCRVLHLVTRHLRSHCLMQLVCMTWGHAINETLADRKASLECGIRVSHGHLSVLYLLGDIHERHRRMWRDVWRRTWRGRTESFCCLFVLFSASLLLPRERAVCHKSSACCADICGCYFNCVTSTRGVEEWGVGVPQFSAICWASHLILCISITAFSISFSRSKRCRWCWHSWQVCRMLNYKYCASVRQ